MKSQKSLWTKIAEHIELIIVLLLIILNIFDLLEYLSPTFDYIDKISGIIAIAYLIYLLSPTKIILGTKDKWVDFSLIISFVLLMFNKITTAAAMTYEVLKENAASIIEISKTTAQATSTFTWKVANLNHLTSVDLTTAFYQKILALLTFSNPIVYFKVTDGTNEQILAATTTPFSITNMSHYIDGSLFYVMKFVTENQVSIEKYAFYVGGILLILLSIYCSWNEKIKPSSLLHVLHGDTKRFHKKPQRAVAIFLCFCFFFLFIFQLMVEWLGVVIDAPIAFLGILFMFIIIIKYRHLFGVEHIITQLGETGEDIYEEFISLFHTPYGVALGLAGILVLHLVTDFAIYIISYTIFQHEMLYFDQGPVFFAAHHMPLFSIMDIFSNAKISLLSYDLGRTVNALEVIQTIWIYLLNIIGIIFLFLAPAYIWWVLFRKHKAHEQRWILVLISIAVVTFLLFPLFHLGRIEIPSVIGTDVQTSSITETDTIFSMGDTFIVSLITGAIVYLISFKKWIQRDLVYLSFAAAVLFFTFYSYYFFIDIAAYYGDVLMYQFAAGDYFVLFYIAIFGLLSVLFYPVSFGMFVYELLKHYRLAKKM